MMRKEQLTICSDCLSAITRKRISSTRLSRCFITIRAAQLTTSTFPQSYTKARQLRYASSLPKIDLSPAGQKDLNGLHTRVEKLSASVLKPTDGPVPTEQRVLYVLEQLESIARAIADTKTISSAASIRMQGKDGSATSALLGSVNTRKPVAQVSKASLLSVIIHRAEEIIEHPNVFITSAILKTYVCMMGLLHRPASFPKVFDLYANKPTPTAGSNGTVTYRNPNSNSIKAAIDQQSANAALSAAIQVHDLSLALDVVETSFATEAYARAKIVRQGAIPGTAFTLAPLVAYGIGTQYGAWQTMLDPGQATMMAFAGIMTYIAAVGGVGYVAITTANDQMDRVTWQQGVPLHERWTREEERAAMDRIAGAWGFKSIEKRGDEEGEDWEILRETCGRKGMVLDKVELMEGME